MRQPSDRPLSYRGRPLPRPGEELVDQGLGFDVATLLTRRQALRAFGLGAAALGLAACSDGSGDAASRDGSASATAGASTSAGSAGSGEIPEETAGPFPGDGSNGPDILAQSGVVRSDIRSSIGDAGGTAEGVPMRLQLTITNLASGGKGFQGAAVYVWHCDREGGYSMYSPSVEAENYLRGVQIADANGTAGFTSIFPACYAGRWPHIHFEVYPDRRSITDDSNVLATSQLALPQPTCEQVYARPGYEQSVTNLSQVSLNTDNVFGDDSGASQLASVTGDVTNGLTVSLVVGVDTATT